MLKRVFCVLLMSTALLAAVPAGVKAATPSPCSGRCVQVAIPLPKGVNVTSNQVRFLLPAGYWTSTARYPVVYLLCGAAGDETEWMNRSDISALTANMQAIFVMPDCGGAVGQPGWYSNWANGKYQWESYYINVLMPWVDSHARTVPGDNGIAGLSMGGYGALDLAARHPTLFRAVGSFSGLADNQYGGPAGAGIFPTAIWGDSQTDAANWAAHNPAVLAANLKGKALYISCGTGGPVSTIAPTAVSTATAQQAEENYLFQTHGPFLAALEQDHIPFTSDFYGGGSHTWNYFQAAAHWGLPKMVATLEADAH